MGPLRFVVEVLGATPDDWQEVILLQWGAGRRHISIQSCHGPGKTTLLSWMICYMLCCRYPQKTVCTAPTGQQLYDALFAETKMWFARLPDALRDLFEIKSDRIELRADAASSFASFRTARAEQPEALQGVHSVWVLLIADEASGVPEQIFEAAVGSMSGANATTVLAGNPVRTSGLFFDSQDRLAHMWFCVQVSAIPRDGAYTSKRVDPQFVVMVREQYGEDSNAFRVRVLGLPPKADLDTIIPYEMAASAVGRDVRCYPTAVTIWGLDVARFGWCLTALAKRRGNHLLQPIQHWNGLDLMQVCGVVKAEWDATKEQDRPVEICVDAIGLGAGVADRLKEMGLPVRSVNVSETPALTGRFPNIRSELWWLVREWFSKRDVFIPAEQEREGDFSRPTLLNQLVAVKYKIMDSSGKLRAESKEEMRKRGRHSPDLADAFCLTFASPAATMLAGNERRSWKQPLKRANKGIV